MEYQRTKAACNFFIEKAKEENRNITPMQAIKLTYFAHGYCLGILDHPLIDDRIEAWQFGAVIPSLYHSLKIYGAGDIRFPIIDMSNNNQTDILDFITLSDNEINQKYNDKIISFNFDDKEKELLNATWEVYKDKDAFELSNIMHQENTPWDIVYNQKDGKNKRHAIISNAMIEGYYKERIKN